jgi:hypothetical protein
MTKEFVPYELALKLKELGFDEPCWAWWHIEDCDTRFCYSEQRSPIINSRETEIVGLPTFSQAFRWFREKYNLEGQVTSWIRGGIFEYYYSTQPLGKSSVYNCDEYIGKTYEEAELECLKKLIQIVKNK